MGLTGKNPCTLQPRQFFSKRHCDENCYSSKKTVAVVKKIILCLDKNSFTWSFSWSVRGHSNIVIFLHNPTKDIKITKHAQIMPGKTKWAWHVTALFLPQSVVVGSMLLKLAISRCMTGYQQPASHSRKQLYSKHNVLELIVGIGKLQTMLTGMKCIS